MKKNPDKVLLKRKVREMHADGMSYRQISRELDIHFTRVGQIIRGKDK